MWHSRPPRDPPPFMANTILNFHFDYLHPSLRWLIVASAAQWFSAECIMLPGAIICCAINEFILNFSDLFIQRRWLLWGSLLYIVGKKDILCHLHLQQFDKTQIWLIFTGCPFLEVIMRTLIECLIWSYDFFYCSRRGKTLTDWGWGQWGCLSHKQKGARACWQLVCMTSIKSTFPPLIL